MKQPKSKIPRTWIPEEARPGSWVLLAFLRTEVHLLAPPGVRVQQDESQQTCACWRYAVWREDAKLGPPAISIDTPDEIAELDTAAVVRLLPVDLHDFVRIEMKRQLCRATTFGKPAEGRLVKDRHAQLAGRALSWTTEELESAFPGEHWYQPEEPEIRIPRTIEELLKRLPEKS